MNRDQKDYYSSAMASHARNSDTTARPGSAKSRHLERNRRIAEMIARQEAARPRVVEALEHAERRLFSRLMAPAEVVAAIALGWFALMMTRFLRFLLLGQDVALSSVTAPDLDMVVDVVLAICIGFMMRQVLALKPLRLMGSQFAGIVLGTVMMHNMVHEQPEFFAHLFSKEWVGYVTTQTAPGSVYFRGHSYAL